MSFLKALRDEGFTIGVDTHLKLVEVLKNIPASSLISEYRDFICPIIATNDLEQAKFEDVFDKYVYLLELTDSESTELKKETQQTHSPEEKPNKKKYYLISIAISLIFGVGSLILYKTLFPDSEVPKEQIEINGCMDSTAINYNPAATKPCDNCCQEKIVGCIDSLAINFNPEATVACENCCEYPKRVTASKPKQYPITEYDSTTYKPSFSYLDASLPTLLAIDDDLLYQLYTHRFETRWLLLSILIGLLLATIFYRRKNNYVISKQRGNEPPFSIPIRIEHNQEIDLDHKFFRLLNLLRGRQESENKVLNIPRTIKSTIQKGGQWNFQYSMLNRPVDYLLLIDQNRVQNHESQLFEYLYQELERNEVYVERYFFDGDPQICWNEKYPSGIPLEQLAGKYPHSKLIVLSRGYGFIHPYNGYLEDWTKSFNSWKERAILTPAPIADWSYREVILSEAFVVLPANLEGLFEMTDLFEKEKKSDLSSWKYQKGKNDHAIILDANDLFNQLNQYFSASMQRWISACAFYPELHWNLTLKLGEVLSDENNNLLIYKNIQQLSRLQWYQDGIMPDIIRQKLVNNPILSPKNKQSIRDTIISVLEDNIPTNKNSLAYEEYQMQLALNKLLYEQVGEENKKWLQLYREQSSKSISGDHIAIQEVDQKYQNPLAFLVPKGMREYFFKKGQSSLGWKNKISIISTAILGLLIFISPYLWTNADFEEAQEFNGKHYILNSIGDSLAFYTHQSVDFLEKNDYIRVDSIFTLVNEQIKIDTLKEEVWKQFTKPVLHNIFNRTLLFYNNDEYRPAQLIFADIKSLNNSVIFHEHITYLDLLQIKGLVYFYSKNIINAKITARDIMKINPEYFHNYVPNLYHIVQYDFVDSMHFGMVRVRKESKYGFLDSIGKLITSPLPFRYAENFGKSGHAYVVTPNNSQCIVNKNLTIVNCFDQLTPYEENGKWGYVNENYVLIIPNKYDFADEFIEDRARVKLGTIWKFIDKSGNDISQTAYDKAKNYNSGLAPVQKNGLWGYIDINGKTMISLQYNEAETFNNGVAIVQKGGNTYSINKEGKCIDNCPDRDGDTVPDEEDMCPDIKGEVELKGCPSKDSDNDNIPDAIDNCINHPNDDQTDTDNDGKGDVCDSDDDNDGIPDKIDNCPLVPNSDQNDFDNDGKGDACDNDDDNDGVPDDIDKCPFSSSNNVIVNQYGCEVNQTNGIIPKKNQKNIFHVKERAKGDGSSWGNALGDLQIALLYAEQGDQVWVAKGTYFPTSTDDRAVAFHIKDGIQVYGGFIGNETKLEERDYALNQTILSGEIGDAEKTEDNSQTIVIFSGVSNATILDGFTIKDAVANGYGGNGDLTSCGAAIFNDASMEKTSSPVINNCILVNNYAREGAGIYNFADEGTCEASINNCQFINNRVDFDGAGIFNDGNYGKCNVSIKDCQFIDNKATYGAGILNHGSRGETKTLIERCLFANNHSIVRGSAIYSYRATKGICEAIVIDCSF